MARRRYEEESYRNALARCGIDDGRHRLPYKSRGNNGKKVKGGNGRGITDEMEQGVIMFSRFLPLSFIHSPLSRRQCHSEGRTLSRRTDVGNSSFVGNNNLLHDCQP